MNPKTFAKANAGKMVREGNITIGQIVGYGKKYIYIKPTPKSMTVYANETHKFISVIPNVNKNKATIRLSVFDGLKILDNKPAEVTPVTPPSRFSLIEID